MLVKTEIIQAYQSAPDDMRSTALTWYQRAHNECLLLSQVYSLPLSQVIGVVAALSPNNKWVRNLQDAWKFLDKPHMNTKVCTFKGQRRKALNILKCDGSEEAIQAILNGDKTKNFFNNILNYSTSTRVTVDVWMYRLMDLKPSKKNYSYVESTIQEAANDLNLMPHQLQAVLWGVARGKIA